MVNDRAAPLRLAVPLALATWASSACLSGDASFAADGSGGSASTSSSSSSGADASSSSANGPGGGAGSAASTSASPASASSGDGGSGDGGLGGDGGAASSSASTEASSVTSSGSGGGGGGGEGPLVHTYVFGGSNTEEVFDARFSADNSIYVAGAFRSGPAIFDAPVLGDCNGTRRGYLVRLDGDLQAEWVRCFGADESEIVSMAFDGAGNAYAFGRFSGTLEIADETWTRDELTLFVVSLDDQGEPRWAREYPAPAATRPNAITRTPDALYITGSFRGEITLGAQTLQGNAQYDGFLARIDSSDGAVDWALHQVEGAAGVNLYAASSPAGTSPLLLAGEFTGDLTLVDPAGDERNVTDVDGAARDIYVAEIDADDGHVVGPIKRIGGLGEDHVTGFDGGDTTAALAGTFHGTVDVDGDSGLLEACTATDGDAFVVRIDADDQTPLSVLCVGGAGDQVPRSVAMSRDGLSTSLGGDFATEVDWGTGSASATIGATADAFVVEADDELAVTLGDAFGGGTGVRSIRGADNQNSGRFLFAGTFGDAILLPDGAHDSAGGADAFVVLYDALP